ncbi:YppG family protein [Ferdinandcohnia sp. Marseille-Q9671]
MYSNYRRNKYVTRPNGFATPYQGQPTYQYVNYGGYQPYWNYPSPHPYLHGSPSSYGSYSSFSNQMPYQAPYPNPYPTGMGNQQPQGKGASGLLSQFKTKEGTYDINKLMDTAGQMVGAVNQVNSIVKGLTKTFKV